SLGQPQHNNTLNDSPHLRIHQHPLHLATHQGLLHLSGRWDLLHTLSRLHLDHVPYVNRLNTGDEIAHVETNSHKTITVTVETEITTASNIASLPCAVLYTMNAARNHDLKPTLNYGARESSAS